GVTNVGRRPTFNGSRERVVECHVLDFDREVYGQEVELSFLKRLRGERAFSSVEALRTQIAEDARVAREYLATEGC
ncbi:MAG: riboflavin kinase, partial [Thermoanaerobaculia bacterium]